MSEKTDYKTLLLRALMVGCVGVGFYTINALLNREYAYNELKIDHSNTNREEAIKDCLKSLKDELSKYSSDLPRDPKDGLITREFYVKIHSLIYKYKKFGHVMIVEANANCRIDCLNQM